MATDNNTSHVVFKKEFTQQEAIPRTGIDRAIALMENGRLHRYNTIGDEISEVALLEKEYAEYVHAKYCAAFSSCGSAIYVALKSVGVTHGDAVLCNAFTLAPVPGAIENAGGHPVLVEITDNFVTDLQDLEQKAVASQARFLLLSHMRGHIVDMHAVTALCARLGITLVEDCAHTAGCRWDGQFTGTFGKAGCFSTQTYKHMNSGEGGLLVSDDDEIIAQAILYSGSYMLYDRHIARPPLEVFERFKQKIPNFSLRMSNLQAALVRPQLADLDRQCERWNARYDYLAQALGDIGQLRIPHRDAREQYVGSSMQFTLKNVTTTQAQTFLQRCGERGVQIKWFGAKEPVGFTSSWENWQYIRDSQKLPRTRKILDFMCDFRIPLTFSLDDCAVIARVIRQVAAQTFGRHSNTQT